MSGDNVKYELTINQPTRPKGEPIQIVGLGTFENGGTYAVTKEEADGFRTYHTRQVPVRNTDDDTILGSTTELGPTLLQASKNMYGVEVSTAGSDDGDVKERGQSNTSSDTDTSVMVPQVPDTVTEVPTKEKGGTVDTPKVKDKDKGGEK